MASSSSYSSSSPSKTVTLVSSDGLNLVVDERAVAMSSVLLNNLTEGDDWAEYINVSAEDLFHILMVANFLDIQGLLELAAQQAANLMKGKKVEDIRDMFGITNDYTAEEEEKLHEKNAWAFL